MKRHCIYTGITAVWLLATVLTACVPKGYQQAVDLADIYEKQKQYEEAYRFYKQALELQPKDKALQTKLDDLGRLIANDNTDQAVAAYENKRYRSSLELLKKALVYDPANGRAAAYTEKAKDRYANIQALYKKADLASAENDWIEAVELLNEIAASYNEDPDIGKKITAWKEKGYNFYMQQGLLARHEGRYDLSLIHLEAADRMMPGHKGAEELSLVKNYLQAEEHYRQAREKENQKDTLAAMEELLLAGQLVTDHAGVNQLSKELLPSWSALMLTTGKRYSEAKHFDKAYACFSKLYAVNPLFPEAKSYFLDARASFLNFNYRHLVRAFADNEYNLVDIYAGEIINVAPAFLDTREIIMRALQKRFNRYYQKGLQYMAVNNDGKAILCFRSAEQVLGETTLTRDLIKQSLEKIKAASRLNVALWEFFDQIDDPGISAYATAGLNDLLRQQNAPVAFQNIYFNFEDIRSESGAYRTRDVQRVDWGGLTAAGYNAVITGKIKQLEIEKAVTSEWKVGVRRIKKIVDNPEYARLGIRQAQLHQALNDKQFKILTDNAAYLELVEKRNSIREKLQTAAVSQSQQRSFEEELDQLEEQMAVTDKERPMRSSEINNELDELIRQLAATPQKIEQEMDEETPYQVVRHVVSANTRIELQIGMPGGRELWPAQDFEDILKVEDTVVPPNLNSDDPQERQGDPLSLPPDSVIKQQAVDALMARKIYPALLAAFENYGMRYYERARANDQAPEEADFPSVGFYDAIEDYFKFLVCTQATDTRAEEVRRKLDGFIGSHWLIGGPKTSKGAVELSYR